MCVCMYTIFRFISILFSISPSLPSSLTLSLSLYFTVRIPLPQTTQLTAHSVDCPGSTGSLSTLGFASEPMYCDKVGTLVALAYMYIQYSCFILLTPGNISANLPEAHPSKKNPKSTTLIFFFFFLIRYISIFESLNSQMDLYITCNRKILNPNIIQFVLIY